MTHKTIGIILRTVKYGETSLIVTMLTSSFGVQSYIVNGVRTISKKGNTAAMYVPAAILQMEVYHKADRNLHRIKEASWLYMYKDIFSSVPKHSAALYMMEVLYKLLKQPEGDAALFDYCSEALQDLDSGDLKASSLFALYVTVHLPHFFGFSISASSQRATAAGLFFDMETGDFMPVEPTHNNYLQNEDVVWLWQLAKAESLAATSSIDIPRQARTELLEKLHLYYAFHQPDFGSLRTLPVLKEVFS